MLQEHEPIGKCFHSYFKFSQTPNQGSELWKNNFARRCMNGYHIPAWLFDILKYLDIETIDLNLQEAAEYYVKKEIDMFVHRHWFGWV